MYFIVCLIQSFPKRSSLLSRRGHSPKLGSHFVSLLLYANDAVILSRTCIGMKHLLRKFIEYLEKNYLQLKYSKYLILVFGKIKEIIQLEHQWNQNQPSETNQVCRDSIHSLSFLEYTA